MSGTDILDQAVEQHKPFAVFSAFSGGNDSLAAARLASQHPLFRGCFHANTGIGIEDTREFVRETCKRESWPLHEYAAPEGQYERMVTAHGFPGPPQHTTFYSMLKERQLRRFVKDQKAGRHRLSCLVLVTGVRKGESARRMGTAQAVQKQASVIWTAPLLHWSREQVTNYVSGLPQNPVSKALGMSGECLCGAFAKPGELDRIGLHYPEMADRLVELEGKVAACGFKGEWDGQRERRVRQEPNPLFLSLCVGCEWKG